MAEEQTPNQTEKSPGRNVDEIALEMMKFIALTSGYGKPSSTGAGFQGKTGKGGAEEYADALLHLFARCRDVVKKG
jgi:hypothetical protein